MRRANGIPERLAEKINANATGRWPSHAGGELYRRLFSLTTTEIDTLSTSVAAIPLQTASLNDFYRTLPANSGLDTPEGQTNTVAAIRNSYRERVLPYMPGQHLVAPRVLDLLPERLRAGTITHWLSINDERNPAAPSSVRLLPDNTGFEPGETLLQFYDERHPHDPPAAFRSVVEIVQEGDKLVQRRPEIDSDRFWGRYSLEAEHLEMHFQRLGATALSVADTNAALRAML